MQIIDRYIRYNVAISIAIVMLVLLSLFTFFTFLDELNDVGKGRYTTLLAVWFVILNIPNSAYQLMPVTALLGSTIGLGMLATHSELIAIRAAGVSVRRIIWAVMKIALLISVITVLLGEFLAPMAAEYAQTMRSAARSNQLIMQSQQGFWAKDGEQYINVRQILPGNLLGDVYIYRIDDAHRMKQLAYAQRAEYIDNTGWVLKNVNYSVLEESRVTAKKLASQSWLTGLNPELLSVVTVKPATLSAVGLHRYVNYLEKNGLAADQYDVTLWSKIALPITTGLMVILAMPFVFGPLRSVSIGTRILGGTMVGITFHLLTQLINYIAIVYSLHAPTAAFVPPLLALVLAVVMFRRVF